MATLSNLKDPAELQRLLEGMNEGELVGQQISQQGAIHVLEFLLREGCSTALALAVLASLRENVERVVEVAKRKGFERVFDKNVTGFH